MDGSFGSEHCEKTAVNSSQKPLHIRHGWPMHRATRAGSQGGRRWILVDRDGVLVENCPQYLTRSQDIVVLPGIQGAFEVLRAHDISVVIVSNQACIGKGIISADTASRIHCEVVGAFGIGAECITDTYICPHMESALCGCRKPRPGLLIAAIAARRGSPPPIAIVGDAASDMEAGYCLELPTIMVRTGIASENDFAKIRSETVVVDSFLDASYLATQGAERWN